MSISMQLTCPLPHSHSRVKKVLARASGIANSARVANEGENDNDGNEAHRNHRAPGDGFSGYGERGAVKPLG